MIKQFLVIVFLIVLLVSILIYLLQRHLIYFPMTKLPQRELFHADDMQEISLLTSDGLKLNAWYKAAEDKQPTLLYLHGNAGHIGYRMPLVRQFLNAGLGVLLLEYRGYGGNEGKPTEEGLYTDGRAALQFLQQHSVPMASVVLYGESLGTGIATKLANEFPVCSIILQSPFSSLSAVARYHYPWVIIKPWDKFDSLARIDKIKMPLLILHGTTDEVVPYTQGLALYNQANQPKMMLTFENKGHNDLWNKDFSSQVLNFINAQCF